MSPFRPERPAPGCPGAPRRIPSDRFLSGEDGAVAVDFVPLVCAVIGLGFGVFSFISATLEVPSQQVADTLESVLGDDVPGVGGASGAPGREPLPEIEQPPMASAPPAGGGAGGTGASTPDPAPGNGGDGASSAGPTEVVSVTVVGGVGVSGGGGGASDGAGGSLGGTGGDSAVFGVGPDQAQGNARSRPGGA